MLSRREFLQRATLLSGGLGAFATIPASILKALEIEPAAGSTFMDAEHVVILMQENRSFDHAFGSLRGVRGFEDPRAIQLPDGNPVWLQTDVAGNVHAPFGLKMHETSATWMSCLPHDRRSQIKASNRGKHDQWLKAKRSGIHEYAEMPLTLGYYDRGDLPFYYAFADAFTICDQHFCAVQSSTSPNRLFHWTGTNRDPRDPAAAVRITNELIDHDATADWTTFPERLEAQGISWRVYQNQIYLPTGLSPEETAWLSNFGDNALEYFSQYHIGFSAGHRQYLEKNADRLRSRINSLYQDSDTPDQNQAEIDKQQAKLDEIEEKLVRFSDENFAKLSAHEKAIHQKAFTINTGDLQARSLVSLTYQDGENERTVRVPAGDVFHQFRKDVNEGKLPTVSWLAAPENFSDHPSAPWYGAWYVSEVLDILTHDPEVWKKTIFILTYDENDGYYDHVPPYVPPHPAEPGSGAASPGLDTTLEFDEGGHPIGLGFRVPLVIASPWTRGGHVCSQVFDHTSVLQFLEVFLQGRKSPAIRETNISAWRRAICGDLTSAFRPHDGTGDVHPVPVKRDEWVEDIHRSSFKNPPDGFRSFTTEEIASIRANPLTSPLLPRQESGTRPSRALPYELHAEGKLDRDQGLFRIRFQAGNARFGSASAGAPFQVRAPGGYQPDDAASYTDAPFSYERSRRWSFAAAAGSQVDYAWPLAAFEDQRYDLQVTGPNGFSRGFRGGADDPPASFALRYGDGPHWILTVSNDDLAKNLQITVTDAAYGLPARKQEIAPGGRAEIAIDLSASGRWYDFMVSATGAPHFSRRYSGRVETGEDGISDPVIGRRAIATSAPSASRPGQVGSPPNQRPEG